MILIRLCPIILALLLLASCSEHRPKGPNTAPHEKLSDVAPVATQMEKSSTPDKGRDVAQPFTSFEVRAASLRRPESDGVNGPAAADKKPSNDLCYVCHLDFDGEEIVKTHLAQKMGCTACHGPSDAHMSDEEHLTAPDIILKRSDVNNVCGKCHKKRERCPRASDAAPRKTAATSPYGEITVEEKVCTDCHGEHKLEE